MTRYLSDTLWEEFTPSSIREDRRKDLSFSWTAPSKFHKWVSYLRKGASAEDLLFDFKERCIVYSSALPFKDNKLFLDWCYNIRSRRGMKTDSRAIPLVKFAIALDSSYLGVSLLDPNEEIRELARIMTDHQDF